VYNIEQQLNLFKVEDIPIHKGDIMSELYLIRHGQASFGTADYDRLSEKGIRQASVLGDHLADLDVI